MTKIDRIIKAENLLRKGVDPRKIFSSIRGVPRKGSDSLDYFTVHLPGVGENWLVGGKLLDRDIWYTSAGIFKKGRCTVGMGEDYNWIKESGEVLIPDHWLEGTKDFDENGVALGKLNEKYGWFGLEGELLSEEWYSSVKPINQHPNLFIIRERELGYNICKSDGIPILPMWYCVPPTLFPNETSIVVAKEAVEGEINDGIDTELEFSIVNMKGEYISPWYTWIGGIGDPSGYGVVIQKEGKERYNFINGKGEILTPTTWYKRAAAFVDGKGTVTIGDEVRWIDSSGQILEEKPIF